MRQTVQASLLSISLALGGCGHSADRTGSGAQDPNQPYDLQGVWTGFLDSDTYYCAGISIGTPANNQVSLAITPAGGSDLLWKTECGDLYFSQSDNVATQLHAVTCPVGSTPSYDITAKIHDSQLMLEDDKLYVDLVTNLSVISHNQTVNCNNSHATGALMHAE